MLLNVSAIVLDPDSRTQRTCTPFRRCVSDNLTCISWGRPCEGWLAFWWLPFLDRTSRVLWIKAVDRLFLLVSALSGGFIIFYSTVRAIFTDLLPGCTEDSLFLSAKSYDFLGKTRERFPTSSAVSCLYLVRELLFSKECKRSVRNVLFCTIDSASLRIVASDILRFNGTASWCIFCARRNMSSEADKNLTGFENMEP